MKAETNHPHDTVVFNLSHGHGQDASIRAAKHLEATVDVQTRPADLDGLWNEFDAHDGAPELSVVAGRAAATNITTAELQGALVEGFFELGWGEVARQPKGC